MPRPLNSSERRFLEREAACYRWLRQGPSPIMVPGYPWVVQAVMHNGLARVVPCYGEELDRLMLAAIGG